jgi:hypothetical protein
VRNEWILRFYQKYGIDVMNLSGQDLIYAARYFKPGNHEGVPNEYKGNFISSNLKASTVDYKMPLPYVIREVSPAGDGSATKIRIAFVGVADSSPIKIDGIKIIDPLVPLRVAITAARRKADAVIVLAHMKEPEALSLAGKLTGVDAFICGNGEFFTRPKKVAGTLVIFTPYETRMLGELRFYRVPGKGYTTKIRYSSIDLELPDDPDALEMVNKSEAARVAAVKGADTKYKEWAAASNAEMQHQKGYAPASACASCHAPAYAKWSGSGHMKGLGAFVSKTYEFETSCLECHATGFTNDASTSTAAKLLFGNIDCETCHGPGAAHALNPEKGYGMPAIPATICKKCHTAITSPNFSYVKYWEKIKH